MSNYGFVYIAASESMPGVLKIGSTEKSPRLRVDELSRATGVPTPFEVVCYIDVRQPREVERQIHQQLAHLRVNKSREFFLHEPSLEAIRAVCMYPDRFDLFHNSYELLALVHAAGVEDLWGLPDPWTPKKPAAAKAGPASARGFN
nr:hypothetical protein [Ralstonia sp.]